MQLKHVEHLLPLLLYPPMECSGREANFLLKRLAQSISIKWEKPLGQTTGWLRAKLSFAILRATNLCLRGSCTKWRSGVGMDGAGLPAELPKLD